MKLSKFTVSALAALLIGAAPHSDRAEDAAAQRIRAHVEFLASDLLEGRDTGSRGHEIAANYVASEFRQLGLTPGGPNGSWFVQVPFRRASLQGTPRIALTAGGRTIPLAIGKDAAVRPSITDQQVSLAAPLVFVGYGISDRRLGIDDYAGLDVRGKIAVGLGDPAPGIPGEIASHLGSIQADVAASRGAVAFISIDDPTRAARDVQRYGTRPAVDWIDAKSPAGGGRSRIARVALSSQIAERLFRGSPMSLQRVRAQVVARKSIKGFNLPARLSVSARSQWQDFNSPEVVAVLPGSDPRVAAEHIVLTGHLDHLGVKSGTKPGEDSIYNGALDNAAGVATMLEAARKFVASGKPPRRSAQSRRVEVRRAPRPPASRARRFRRRRPAWEQPLRRKHRRPGRPHRKAGLALPDGAPRHLGSGPAGTAGPGDRDAGVVLNQVQRHPDVAMVSFTDEIIDADGSAVREHAAKGTETMFGLSEFIALGPWAQRKLQISGASRAILRSTIETFGALTPECQAEDTPYILRSLYCGKGLVCHWAGIRYRRHQDQLSTERSIASMDPGSFTRQYLRDLETARSHNLLDARLGAEVERWIDDTDLFFRLRRIDYGRDGLTGAILFRAMDSSALSLREKLGLAKRYLLSGFLGDRLRRGKAHLVELSLEPREYLRHVLFDRARTDSARWSLESSFQRDWDARTELIARHVHAGDRVAEFGAGMQALRKALPQDCVYQPFDLVARTDDTRVCDLNTKFPEIEGEYNVAVFSGVLEYLGDLVATFGWLGRNFERVVFSYAPSDLVPSPLVRNRHGWVNNLSRRDLVRLARKSGFECRVVDTWRNHVIFLAVRQ